MITFKIQKGHLDTIEFQCPHCKAHDVIYMSMPELCWTCGGRYAFNLTELALYQDERVHHHFHSGTSDCHD